MKLLQVFFSASLLCLMFACSDPCDDVNCGDNGSCDDGTCICETGYEGTNCESLTIDRYTGSWVSSAFQCAGDSDEVNFIIEQGSTITEIQFYEVSDPEYVFTMEYADDILTIPSQTVDEITVSGSGTLNADGTMTLMFDIVDEGEAYSCSGTFSK